MLSNAELGLAIPVVVLILALFTLRDPEFQHTWANFKNQFDKPIDFGKYGPRGKLILIAGAVLLVAGIFATAGIYYAKSRTSGGIPVSSPTDTPVLTAENIGTQTAVSSPSAVSVSSPSAITVPSSTFTPDTIPTAAQNFTTKLPPYVLDLTTTPKHP